MARTAPIARFASAYVVGVAVGLLGAPPWVVAPVIISLALVVPILASPRPVPPLALSVVAVLGVFAGAGDTAPASCGAVTLRAGASEVAGHFLAAPRSGSGPFQRADGCGAITVVVPATSAPPVGRPVIVHGTWKQGRYRPWIQATRIEASAGGPEGPMKPIVWAMVRWRDGLVERLHRLYGPRAPLVSALVLARREGLDPGVRDRFAATGISHLLAISGFHVGVIAGLVFGAFRAMRFGARRAGILSAAVVWLYVLLIGLPDAACRAALIFTLVAVSRARGRPPSRWGPLSTAALALLLVDPSKLGSPGFQLSFAGAAGLMAWSRPVGQALERFGRGALPRALVTGTAAGLAATLATLPVVAWHFGRVSAVGVPMTLFATPLVTLALPGALLSLAVDVLSSDAAGFFSGGVRLTLDLLVAVVDRVGAWPGASVWTQRSSVIAGCVGVLIATRLAKRPGIGGRARRHLVALYTMAAILGWPVMLALEGRGTLELMAIDVGQGDAVALRSPKGRWILVDAGPPSDGAAAAHPVVQALKARGVRRLELLILTHADADHFGGAGPVLRSLPVGRVLDPVLPAPKSGYVDVLRIAESEGVPWSAARAGQRFDLDGISVRVLHPSEESVAQALRDAGPTGVTEANDLSVVVLVEWNGFAALLTGDAYVGVEQKIAPTVGDVDLLKVGHHGSRTSTDSSFLATIKPEVAIVSVGARNRYGHPAPEVVRRLEVAGAVIERTDLQGTITVRVAPDGSIRTEGKRSPRP